jgi:hypothetical protein
MASTYILPLFESLPCHINLRIQIRKKNVRTIDVAIVYKNPQTTELCEQIGIPCRINPDGVIPTISTAIEPEIDADLEEAKKRALALLQRFS